MFATVLLLFFRQQKQRSNAPTAISRTATGRPTLIPSFLLGDFRAGWLIKIREGPVCRISVPLSSLFMMDRVIFWVAISDLLEEYQLLKDIIAKPEDLIIDVFEVARVLSLFWADKSISIVLLVPGKAVGSQMTMYRSPLVEGECIRNIWGTNLDSIL